MAPSAWAWTQPRAPEPPGFGLGLPLLPTHTHSLWLLGQNTALAAGKAAGRLATLSLSSSLNYLRIFTGRCQHKEDFHSFSFAVAPILRDPSRSPPGNPSETHPLLPRPAQLTGVDKRQEASHQVNGSLMTRFSIRQTPNVLERGELCLAVHIWPQGEQKQPGLRKDTQRSSQGRFCPERNLSLGVYKSRSLSRLLPHLLGFVQVMRSQLRTFRYSWTPQWIPRLWRKAGTSLPWTPSEQGLTPGSATSVKFQGCSLAPREGCLSRWLHHFGALSPPLRALSPELPPKSYAFWNTVTLQPWPRISAAFPKRYAHGAKKHLQSSSSWYLLCKIKVQRGEKK